MELVVIEVGGRGSPYGFVERAKPDAGWWKCLFPDETMEAIDIRAAAKRLWMALDVEQPDVVLAGAIAFPSGATAVPWARLRHKRSVIMDDARPRDVPRGAIVNWAKRRLYANADALLLPAPSHASDYQFWDIPKDKMFFGVNVVDNGFYESQTELIRVNADRWRAKLGLPRKFILGVGRQVPKKNWSSLLRAWRIFKDQRPATDFQLVLVGNGPEHQSLKELSVSLQLQGVRFDDFVQPAEVVPFYALATGLVLPSLYGETWGLVVNEAMACGLPVLVSRECGCAETLVRPGQNGWTFHPTNYRELASHLVRLTDSPESGVAAMGKRSRDIIAGWGLERFRDAVWNATQHAVSQPANCPRFVDRLIFSAWKGRYRPT
jgi:glycosyltransferase involved in cell wall biosynthesis